MVRYLGSGIAFCTLILVGSAVGCNSLPKTNKVIPQIETPAAPASKRLKSSAFNTLEQSIYKEVNQYRKSRNLPPLTIDARISEQARAHSQAMASDRVPFGHQGFEQRVQAIARAIPYQRAAENVAFNQGYSQPDTQAVEGWIKSIHHRENMEGPYNLTGIGIAKNAKGEYYFTQIFIRSR
ncbi:MAG: CAP domain-containing protein [Chamaesiphon sp.]